MPTEYQVFYLGTQNDQPGESWGKGWGDPAVNAAPILVVAHPTLTEPVIRSALGDVIQSGMMGPLLIHPRGVAVFVNCQLPVDEVQRRLRNLETQLKSS